MQDFVDDALLFLLPVAIELIQLQRHLGGFGRRPFSVNS